MSAEAASVTWWVNGTSSTRHATTGGPAFLCGAALHRNAWQHDGAMRRGTRPCQRCTTLAMEPQR